jgi:Type VI secretion system (T6SS), amidase effector protein 4
MAKFIKPKFEQLLAAYSTEPSSVHACSLLDPTKPGINTCAARMSEALLIANAIVKTRQDIAKLGNGKGTGRSFLLGRYAYPTEARLCPHGIGRGARDMADFLRHHWGRPTHTFQSITEAPDELSTHTGVVAFIKVPGFSGQGHIDLWNQTAMVGHGYWDAGEVWFFQLK